jgi:hypothetical protein
MRSRDFPKSGKLLLPSHETYRCIKVIKHERGIQKSKNGLSGQPLENKGKTYCQIWGSLSLENIKVIHSSSYPQYNYSYKIHLPNTIFL